MTILRDNKNSYVCIQCADSPGYAIKRQPEGDYLAMSPTTSGWVSYEKSQRFESISGAIEVLLSFLKGIPLSFSLVSEEGGFSVKRDSDSLFLSNENSFVHWSRRIVWPTIENAQKSLDQFLGQKPELDSEPEVWKTAKNYRSFLEEISKLRASNVATKDKWYDGSWKKRGGVGAYFSLSRKLDRFESRMKEAGYDIFKAISEDKRGEGIIDDVRDIVGYLLLVEAEMVARGLPMEKELRDDKNNV